MRADFSELSPMPPILVRLTHSKKKMRKWYRELGASAERLEQSLRSSDATTGSFIGEDGSCHLVWMTNCVDYSAEVDAGLLAHEAVHVAQEYFRTFGEDEPSDELYAYVVQSVATHLIGKHFKWKRKQLDKR